MKVVFFSIAICLVLCVFSNTQVVYSQSIPTPTYTSPANSVNPDDLLLSEKIPYIKEQIDVEVNPEKPRPGETVEVSINIYSTDINSLPIVWKISGKEYAKGVGLKNITFTMGESGQETSVVVTLFLKSGNTIKKSITFKPVDVDMLWQAKTYTPPFYKGKALYTPESEVIFTSLPNMFSDGKKIDPETVVYNWYVDYELDNQKSGFNKSSYSYKSPIIIKDVLIKSKAYAASDESVQGSGQVRLSHTRPIINLYEESPTLGILFNRALSGEYLFTEPEVKLAAFPFFFSTENKNLAVTYSWEMDGKKLNLPLYQNSTIFKRINNIKGSTLLKLIINNPRHILQQTSSVLQLRYDK